MVLSASQKLAWMVGGNGPNGSPRGDIWRLDIVTGEWNRLLMQQLAPDAPGAILPSGLVLATSYDIDSGRLLVVDEISKNDEDDDEKKKGKDEKGKDEEGKKGSTEVRITTYDTRNGLSRVLLRIPRLGFHSSVVLGVRPDGTYVLVGQLGASASWRAYAFSVDGASVTWKGRSSGTGLLLDQPVSTTSGMFLPVRRDGVLQFTELPPAAFNVPGGCDGL